MDRTVSRERPLDAFERLRALGELNGLEVAERPLWLPLADIKTAPALFQMREGDAEDGAVEASHVLALARALAAKPLAARTLDPITVYAVAGDAYLIDGHHRLAAYEVAGVTGPVPVVWFKGSLEEAMGEALSLNQKAKLPMAKWERMEGAWRLVLFSGEAKAMIAAKAGVSERTITNLRSTLSDYRLQFPKRPPGRLEEVRAALRGDREWGVFSEEAMEAMIDGYHKRLQKAFGKQIGLHPGLFGEALLRHSGEHVVRQIADDWGFISADCADDGDDAADCDEDE